MHVIFPDTNRWWKGEGLLGTWVVRKAEPRRAAGSEGGFLPRSLCPWSLQVLRRHQTGRPHQRPGDELCPGRAVPGTALPVLLGPMPPAPGAFPCSATAPHPWLSLTCSLEPFRRPRGRSGPARALQVHQQILRPGGWSLGPGAPASRRFLCVCVVAQVWGAAFPLGSP